LAPIPGLGELDWAGPDFALPIDAYAMDKRDVQLVEAARAVLVLQCVNQSETLTDPELDYVRQLLEAQFHTQRWALGNWNAPHVAVHGGQTLFSRPPSPEWPDGLDWSRATDCINEDPGVLEMRPVSPMFGLMLFEDETDLQLVGYWWEGIDLARADPRYWAITEERNDCTRSHGYDIYYPDDGSTGGLAYEDDWTLEERRQAEVTEARCSDDMGYTQQAVDMLATYQLETIANHEAELIAHKQRLDERVAAAAEILAAHGLP